MLVSLKLLALAVTLLLSQCCQTYIPFGHSDCAFHVTYNDSTCFNYIWSNCSWGYNGVEADGQSSDYNHCTHQCCQPEVVYPQNWDGIRQCQAYLNKRAAILFGCIFGVLGVIPLIACSVYCYKNWDRIDIFLCCERLGICCCCLQIRKRIKDGLKKKTPQNIYSRGANSLTWVQDQSNAKLQENCSICLQKGISLELECGHMFHRKCITTWIKRKGTCTICRSSQLNKIKVYCERCFSCYFESTLDKKLLNLDHEGEELCKACQ